MSSGHESRLDRPSLRGKGPTLIGTALYGAVRRVVWSPGANHSRGPDSVSSDTPETDAAEWTTTHSGAKAVDSDFARKLERARNHNRICVARMALERNELREALRKAIVWADSAAASNTERRNEINWSYLEAARQVLFSQNVHHYQRGRSSLTGLSL